MAKTIVKHWVGTSTNSSKADYKEFSTKKKADEHIRKMKRYHNVHGHETSEMANFYELFKKQS